jgi:hypothetical protein
VSGSSPQGRFCPPRSQDFSPTKKMAMRPRPRLHEPALLTPIRAGLDWISRGGAEDLRLFAFDELLSLLECFLLDVYIVQRRFPVHMSKLRHHDLQLNARFGSLGYIARRWPQAVASEVERLRRSNCAIFDCSTAV